MLAFLFGFYLLFPVYYKKFLILSFIFMTMITVFKVFMW